jgi:hypothetical protein
MSMIRPRVEQIAALLLVGLALSGAGCGGDSPPIYEGTTGQTVALTVAGDVPMANVSIALPNGSSAGLLILDTGSPLSLLSEHALSNVGRGFSQLDVNLFELTFAKWQLAVMPLFSPSDCDETVPNGVIGADLLGHFAFHVDYRASKGTLFEPGIGGISGAEQLPVEVLGGGTVRLQGIEQTTRVGATRALIPVEVAGKTVTALIDTGASYVIAKRSLFAEAGACCLAVSTVTGTQSASLVKLASLTIGKTTLQKHRRAEDARRCALRAAERRGGQAGRPDIGRQRARALRNAARCTKPHTPAVALRHDAASGRKKVAARWLYGLLAAGVSPVWRSFPTSSRAARPTRQACDPASRSLASTIRRSRARSKMS